MIVDLTVCTLVRGGRAALIDLLTALDRQSVRPNELVLAYLQDNPHEGLPRTSFPVKSLMVPARPGAPLQKAAARNRASMIANGRTILFLDVDCLPGPDSVRALEQTVQATGGCATAEMRHADEATPSWRFDDLWEHAAPLDQSGGWSPDAFALTKLHCLRLGGFDEKAPAGRDAFAATLAANDVPVTRDPRAQIIRIRRGEVEAQVA